MASKELNIGKSANFLAMAFQLDNAVVKTHIAMESAFAKNINCLVGLEHEWIMTVPFFENVRIPTDLTHIVHEGLKPSTSK